MHSRSDLRELLYKKGFWCDGIHYIRFKRTSGASIVGKCLFINEKLYKRMHKWEMCGIEVKEGQDIDLAALESYISLSTSSIIDTIEINANNILVIDDHESIFKDEVISTSVEDGWLKSEEKVVEISNSIWDGQSLIDVELMDKYSQYGMVVLRNRFFKSCCFNTNIQKWFADNNIVNISQLNGFTLAKDIKDIKLITTPSSIKYLKFGTLQQWLDEIEPLFGIVKHDKPPYFFNGRLVQTHYQLINTLQLTKKEIEKLVQPTFEFIKLLRTDPAVVRYYIKYPEDKKFSTRSHNTKNDIVFSLMGINDKFSQTKLYQDFLNDLIKSLYKSLKCGHILVNGNYSTLFGNPIEMLQHSIGKFTGETQLGIGNIYCKRFGYNQFILGSRSPHVTMGNVWLPYNVDNEQINKYFNLTSEIVCINSINENTLQRLSGADFDSDTVLLTDDKILIEAARRNYKVFKVPTGLIKAKKTKRMYTAEQKADLDIKTGVNKIGEIINFSQVLNSLYWDTMAYGKSHEENHELYCDIAKLDIMSGIEIDKAKKEFVIDNTKELNKLREKYKELLTDDITGKDIKPHFFAHISKIKGYYDPTRKSYSKHQTSMDYLQTVVNSFRIRTAYKKTYSPLSCILDSSKYKKENIWFEQVNRVIDLVRNTNSEIKAVYNNNFLDNATKFELTSAIKQDCVDHISDIKFSYSTMYWILLLIESKDYSDISKMLFSILFGAPNLSFFEVIQDSQDSIGTIYENSKGNITIYGVKHAKTYK